MYTRDTTLQLHHINKDHVKDIFAVIISPDESLLVTSDQARLSFRDKNDCAVLVHDLNKKHVLFKLSDSIEVNERSLITKGNHLVCIKRSYQKRGTVVIYNLKKGEITYEVPVSSTYEVEGFHLHESHDYVLTDFRSTGIINDIRNKFAELICMKTGKLVST